METATFGQWLGIDKGCICEESFKGVKKYIGYKKKTCKNVLNNFKKIELANRHWIGCRDRQQTTDNMALIKTIIRWIHQRCDSCGSDVQGDYINHPTFGTVRTCCARASQ